MAQDSDKSGPVIDADIDPVEAELAEVRAKRRALAAAREARAANTATADALKAEKEALADDEAIAKAEAEHGPLKKKIYEVRTAAGLVIVKRPNHVLYRKFQDSAEQSVVELEKLVRPCLVYPPVEQFDRMLDDQPAILIPVADAVTWLAGFRAKENAAK
jgi:hypothetical protein